MTDSETSAVRSTNNKDPERRARRCWIDNNEGDEFNIFVSCWWVIGLSTKGSNIVMSDCRVRGDTPASVRSPQAPLRRSKPCRRIIIETRSPTVH